LSRFVYRMTKRDVLFMKWCLGEGEGEVNRQLRAGTWCQDS